MGNRFKTIPGSFNLRDRIVVRDGVLTVLSEPGRVDLDRWVKFGNGGGRRENAGTRTAQIVLTIDINRVLAEIGETAATSKSRRAVRLRGAIVAKILTGSIQDERIDHKHRADCYDRVGLVICGHAGPDEPTPANKPAADDGPAVAGSIGL